MKKIKIWGNFYAQDFYNFGANYFFLNSTTLKGQAYAMNEAADYIVNHAKAKFGVNNYTSANEDALFYYGAYLMMGWMDYQNLKKANPNFRYSEDNNVNNRILKVWQYLSEEGEIALSYSIYKNPEYLKKVSAANAASDAAELKQLENRRNNSYAALKNLYTKTQISHAEFLDDMKKLTSELDDFYSKAEQGLKANRAEMLQKIKTAQR